MHVWQCGRLIEKLGEKYIQCCLNLKHMVCEEAVKGHNQSAVVQELKVQLLFVLEVNDHL